MKLNTSLLVLSLLLCIVGKAQIVTHTAIFQESKETVFYDTIRTVIPSLRCKGLQLIFLLKPLPMQQVSGTYIRETATGMGLSRQCPPLLRVHGNILYDFYYQNTDDTAYQAREVHQHTVTTTLNLLFRDQYPFHFTFSTSKSNSQLVRNITGLGLRFSGRDVQQMAYNKARMWDASRNLQWKKAEELRLQLLRAQESYNRLQGWFSEPEQIQRMVLQRERALYGRPALPEVAFPEWDAPIKIKRLEKMPDTILPALANLQEEVRQRKHRVDSVSKLIAQLEAGYQEARKLLAAGHGNLADLLIRQTDYKSRMDSIRRMEVPDSVLPRSFRHLMAIRSAGIGRTMVDYSELTAKNINVMGVQVEYNPSYYLAFATGAVDYSFRDWRVFTPGMPRQYLSIIRAGWGMKDASNLIASAYTGRKQQHNFSGGPNTELPDSRILGFSLEGRWQLSPYHYVTGEVAKSSLPAHARKAHGQNLSSSMVSFDDRSNEAWALSFFSFLPSSQTRIQGTFKHMAANFQSFSLYASGTRQTGWMLKADQPFFRNKLTVSGSVRKNVYESMFENAAYRSNTIFKSIQATFRHRNWPTLSAGYFPSSQLMKVKDGFFVENLFYNLTASASHAYRLKTTGMSTVLTFTKFYNRQSDSNFVYFNSTNVMLNQTFYWQKLSLQSLLQVATNREYKLYGVESGLQYKVTKWLEAGGGLRYNLQTTYDIRQTGYFGNLRLQIPHVGEISVMADQGFVPGSEKKLVSNKTGRIIYQRTF